MITAFPPNILICIDAKYPEPMAFLHEDALQLLIDRFAAEQPGSFWEQHDIADDETLRARRIEDGTDDGETATYTGRSRDGRSLIFRIAQFDRFGAARILNMRETS